MLKRFVKVVIWRFFTAVSAAFRSSKFLEFLEFEVNILIFSPSRNNKSLPMLMVISNR